MKSPVILKGMEAYILERSSSSVIYETKPFLNIIIYKFIKEDTLERKSPKVMTVRKSFYKAITVESINEHAEEKCDHGLRHHAHICIGKKPEYNHDGKDYAQHSCLLIQQGAHTGEKEGEEGGGSEGVRERHLMNGHYVFLCRSQSSSLFFLKSKTKFYF